MPLFDFDPFSFRKMGTTKQDQFAKQAMDDNRPMPTERKGIFRFLNQMVSKKQQRVFTLNAGTIGRLANTDPITWSIRRTIKSHVNQTEWDIVPDTEHLEEEFNRWEEYALAHLSPYAIGNVQDFTTNTIPKDLYQEVKKNVTRILKEPTDTNERKKAIQWYFASVTRMVRSEAEGHRKEVKQIFETPTNRGLESSFRALQELIIDDLLVYDAGCIVKNYSRSGKLAELYHVPGHEIRLYRNEDRTIPLPPEPAYVWENGGIQRAEFTKDELVYIMQNPQTTGYGISPIEIAAYIITASIYADEYNIDYFKNSNVPPGVMDLGKDVTEDQRMLFQQMWENEVKGRGGLHRMMFISGSENPQFIPIRTQTNRDMQMMDYLKWTVSIKTACYGLSPQDIGFMHETGGLGGSGVAKAQGKMTQARGITSMLHLLEQYYNAEIVKKEFKFDDVKFAWNDADLTDPEQESRVDAGDIQAGVLTRNERRKKLGLKPIDGGDVPTISAPSVIPVIQLETSEEDKQDLEQQAKDPSMQGDQKPGEDPNKPPTDGQPQPGAIIPAHTHADPSQPGQEEPLQQNLKVAVKVNRRKPVSKQYEMIHDVVKELQAKGVEATIKIGFEDEKTVEKTKDSKTS